MKKTNRILPGGLFLVMGFLMVALLPETSGAAESTSPPQPKSEARAPVTVDVSVRRVAEPSPGLEFTLTNRSQVAVKARDYDLPIGDAAGVILVAVEVSSMKELQRLMDINDGPFEPVTLKPGESRRDVVQLSYFLEFSEALQRSDVVVFWSYQFPGSTQRFSGAVLFPKTAAATAKQK